MTLSTSSCSCPTCSLQVDLDFIYVKSVEFVQSNIKELLAGHHGAHTCTSCGDRMYMRTSIIEMQNHFEACCEICREVSVLARGNYSVFRQITAILSKARAGDGA